jgi:hypothetical protein
MDFPLLPKPTHQLVVVRLWGVLCRSHGAVDVYYQELSVLDGLSDDIPELCIRHVCGDVFLSGNHPGNALGRGVIDYNRLLFGSKIMIKDKMKLYRYLFLGLLAMTFGLHADAQKLTKVPAGQAQRMIGIINRTSSSIRTIQCDFVQVSDMSFMDDKAVSKGKMSFNASGSLVWQYNSPYKYTFSINNGQVTTKSGGKTQSIDLRNNKMFQNIATMMMNSVSGKCLSNGRDFKVVMYASKKEWVAYLYPQKADFKKMFASVRLHFNQIRRMVQQVEMIQKNGDNIVITLSNVKATYRR